MKTIRVTYSKPGAKAVCLMRYRTTDSPLEIEWSGSRNAFEVAPGVPVNPSFPLFNLERVVAHQANLSGANYTIEDLGGEALEITDEALPPFEEP